MGSLAHYRDVVLGRLHWPVKTSAAERGFDMKGNDSEAAVALIERRILGCAIISCCVAIVGMCAAKNLKSLLVFSLFALISFVLVADVAWRAVKRSKTSAGSVTQISVIDDKGSALIRDVVGTALVLALLITAGILVRAPWWVAGAVILFLAIIAFLYYGLPWIHRRLKLMAIKWRLGSNAEAVSHGSRPDARGKSKVSR